MCLKSLSIDEGQRMSRSSLCCILSVCHFCWDVFFDHWSNGKYTRDLRRELLVYLREALLSRINPILLTYTVASSFVCTSPLAGTTVVGLLETFTVSNSAESKSFLLTTCMLAPESTTNSLSSGFIVDAAGKLNSSVGEKNVALSFSLTLWIFLASIHASPRTHRSCLSVSVWDWYPQIS